MRTGVDLEEALMVLVPEAYRNHPDLMAHYPEARASSLTCVAPLQEFANSSLAAG